MAKYLDLSGLQTFWSKVKTFISNGVTANSPSASKTVTGYQDGKVTYGNIAISESQVTNLTTHLGQKAPLASPALTGTPTAPTAAAGTNTTQIATTAWVNTAISDKMAEADAMVYKGTLAGAAKGTGGYGSLTPAASKGWTYKVTTKGFIDGVAVEVGDMLICNTDNTAAATANNYATIAASWDFIQGNLDGVVIGPASATDAHVAVFDGTTGKLVKDSGFTIGKNVPSNAVFTDTDTKVTSVGNHYTPAEDSDAQLSASATGATAAWSIDVVKGVQLKRDAKGHVVGVSVTSGKIPANPNTDTKVTSVGNHYTPAEDTSAAINASGGSATQLPTASSGSLIQVVTGLKRDAKGHIVGVTSAGLWSPDSNTTYTNEKLGHGYVTCSTATGTAAKVGSLSNYVLTKGGIVAVKFTNAVDANATLNINSKGAKAIFNKGTAIAAGVIGAGDIAYLMYDGTNYQLLGTDRAANNPIVDISRNGTTFTATRLDGTSFTFTQQDNNDDTKNTAGSTDTSSKIFLIGATSQAANPQTYSHDTVYVGTDGCLYSGSKKVATEEFTGNTYEPKMTAITPEEIGALT